MSFVSKRDEIAQDIRVWATRREFEDEGYRVETSEYGKSYYEDPPFWRGSNEPLTVARYKKGETTYNSESGNSHTTTDPNYDYYVPRNSEVWNMKFEESAWVTNLFQEFGNGNPKAIADLSSDIDAVPSKLCGDASWASDQNKKGGESLSDIRGLTGIAGDNILMENAIAEMGRWTGDTAAAFALTFGENGEHWRRVVQCDYYLAEAVVAAVEAQHAIIAATRKDLLAIGNKTIEALKVVNEQPMTDDQANALLIAGAIMAIPLTGMGMGMAVAIMGASTMAGSVLIRNEAKEDQEDEAMKKHEPNIGGDTADAVLNSMFEYIRALKEKMYDNEDELAKELRTWYNGLLGTDGNGDPVNEDFEIIFGQDVDSYSDGGLGERTTEHSETKLVEAATKSFPRAAEPLLAAGDALEASVGNESTAFTSDHGGAVSAAMDPWMNLRDRLQDFVANNAGKVETAGKAILSYAIEAGAVDDDAAKDIEKLYADGDVESSGRDHEKLEDPEAGATTGTDEPTGPGKTGL